MWLETPQTRSSTRGETLHSHPRSVVEGITELVEEVSSGTNPSDTILKHKGTPVSPTLETADLDDRPSISLCRNLSGKERVTETRGRGP